MLRTTNKISAIGLSLGVVFTTCSCDPQKDALKLFQQQGLTVLEPARDYIALGGIFVVPSSGNPVYLDRTTHFPVRAVARIHFAPSFSNSLRTNHLD